MQAAPIRPATLMMEFMATEQRKIGHVISSLEFAQHLEDQHRKAKELQHNQQPGLLMVQDRLPNALEGLQRADGKPRSSREDASHHQGDKAFRSTRGSSARALPRKNLPMCEWRASQQLSFNNPAALDKTLTDLQLSPNLKEAFKAAQNEKGSISLQKFSAILDRAASAKEARIADGKASAADVQALVASLQQGQQGMAEGIEQLKLKESGYYGYDELRQIVKRIVQQSAKEKPAQDGNGALKNPLHPNSASTSPVGSALRAPNANLAAQTQNLATNFIPSFFQDEKAKTSAPDDKPSHLASSATQEKGGARLETTSQQRFGNETGRRDINLLREAGSGSAPCSGEGPDPSASPQTLKGSTGTPNPSGLEGAASNRASAANPAGSPQSTPESKGEQHGPIAAHAGNTPGGSGLKLTGAGMASSLEGIASLVSSVENSGAAVIKSLHLDPVDYKSQDSQTLTSTAAANKAATDSLTEKIAPPTATSGQSAANRHGQSGSFGFTNEAAQSLTAETPSAGATQPGGPEAGSTLGSSSLKTALSGMAGSQADLASLVKSVEGQGEAAIKSRHLDPESNQSQGSQTLTSTAAANKAGTDSLTEAIALPTETSVQSAANKPGQYGSFGFTNETAPSLSAKTPSAGAPQPGTPDDGSTPGSSSLKTALSGVAGSPGGPASLVTSGEGQGEAAIESYHLDPEANKSQTSQTLSSAAADNKAATDGLTEKIAGPTETSGQSMANKQGQPGSFGFTNEAAQSLPANARFAGGAPSGGPLTEAASWPQALSEGIQELHQQKQNHLTLELETKDLGRILVRVQTDRNQVRAMLSAESEQARELLQKSSPQLRQQLEAQGLVLSQLQIDLRQHQEGRRRSNYHDYVSWRARGGASTEAASGRDGAVTLGATTSVHGARDQIINLFA